MCQIPVFCWIVATVFEHLFTTEGSYELPKTLTDLYAHFLLVHMTRNKTKDLVKGQGRHSLQLTQEDSDALLKLGRLAFEQLHKGNVMFYEEDLEMCGLDVKKASVYCGICTKIFTKEECMLFDKSVFSFVHLSVQEFLAAVYIFHAYLIRDDTVLRNFLCNRYAEDNADVMPFEEMEEDEEEEEECSDEEDDSYLDNFLNTALENSFTSKTGHFDLFIRFLHGLSLESNQKLLVGLFGRTESCPEILETIINDLKRAGSEEDVNPDRSINIFHCLTEMRDKTVLVDLQEFLKSSQLSSRSGESLSELQCSALAYMLQVSEEVCEELNLQMYNASPVARGRLVPAVRNCRNAILSNCGLSETHCEIVASALRSYPSYLKLLDISDTELEESSVKLLSDGLQSPHCNLETLRLMACDLSEMSCGYLASALKLNLSHLRELDLGDNNRIKDTGLSLLCGFLQSPDCKLHTLKLNECLLTEAGCASLTSALLLNPSHLRTLDLSINDVKQSGLNSLSSFLQVPLCRLEVLRLEMCSATWISCAPLASALKLNPFHLKELDLSRTDIRDSGALWDVLGSPHCHLEMLKLKNCRLSDVSCASLHSALKSSQLKELDLGGTSTQGLEELSVRFPNVHMKF
ncbi:hypothetical protein NL108_013109 [Boleophthalmus pectinirostris]|nr:hypothetical protein NL108_013109 [Boleophthalmus pectinirostris]